MILLRLISWPYFRRHVLRTLLTVAGIVLGVAVFVGMHTANQSVLFAFSKTVDRIAGKTELQVTAGETGFDEDVLEKVQAAPTVRQTNRLPSRVIMATSSFPSPLKSPVPGVLTDQPPVNLGQPEGATPPRL